MDPEILNTVAMNLYAKLYADHDGVSEEAARQEYEESIPPERRDLIKNAILWLRSQKNSPLEELLPEFYARNWAKPEAEDWIEAFEGADKLDHSEWLPLMRQIIKIED